MYEKHHTGNQHGVATLGITLMLLFIMTLVALYTAKTSIKEQQISANQYRADQSLSTGNAALDWGVAYYSQALGRFCEKDTTSTDCLAKNGMCILNKTISEIMDPADTEIAECEFIYNENEDNRLTIDPDVTEDTYHKKALSRGSSEMYYAFVDVDGDFGTAGEEYNHIKVKSGGVPDVYKTPIKVYGLGHSDDDTGERTVSVTVDTSNVFGDPGPGGINFPLITKSLVSENTGGLTVINRYFNRTISSGDAQAISGNTHTYVAKPDLNCHDWVNRSECINMEPEHETDMEGSEGTDKINSDIIDGNTNLSNLNNDEFFYSFFGMKKEKDDIGEGPAMKVVIDESANGEVFQNTKTWSDLVLAAEFVEDVPPLSLIWIDGEYTPSGISSEVLGSDENPVTLIINGDLKSGGNINIVGILYVIGTWSPGANNTVRGIVIVEGGLSGTGAGGATIVYDADLLNGKTGTAPGAVAAAVPGSWSDWE